MSVAGQLAKVCASAPPPGMLDVMRLCLLDWLIVGRAARQDDVARGALEYAKGEGPASLFFGGSTSPRNAALANGTVSHALDYDDTHFAHIGHVSTVVFPAALAMAEARGAGFERFLHAALMGAEAATRTGVWLGREHYQTGFHQTATAGALGAAVAAGAVIELGDMRGALSNAAGFAAGLKAQFGTAMKPVNAGMAAANGVEAALMAEAGLVGAEDALEHYARMHHGVADVRAFDGIGETWLFESVSQKFYPCCHGTHAMIEAASALIAAEGAPERMQVRTHPRWMSVCNKPAPRDALEAKFSYKLLAALLMQGERITDATLKAAFPLRAGTEALMARVEVIADESVAEEACVVCGVGAEFGHDLRAPMSHEARFAKLMLKGEAVLPAGETDALWQAVKSGDLAMILHSMTRLS